MTEPAGQYAKAIDPQRDLLFAHALGMTKT
jgi:hypothetical protein